MNARNLFFFRCSYKNFVCECEIGHIRFATLSKMWSGKNISNKYKFSMKWINKRTDGRQKLLVGNSQFFFSYVWVYVVFLEQKSQYQEYWLVGQLILLLFTTFHASFYHIHFGTFIFIDICHFCGYTVVHSRTTWTHTKTTYKIYCSSYIFTLFFSILTDIYMCGIFDCLFATLCMFAMIQ